MGKKILVVDDDRAILDAVKMILELSNFEVVTIDSGDVLSKAKKFQPDLILLDVWMNGMDGRDICKQLKNDEHLRSIPVILLSASRDLAKGAKDACANDFLEKPFGMETLYAKIEANIS